MSTQVVRVGTSGPVVVTSAEAPGSHTVPVTATRADAIADVGAAPGAVDLVLVKGADGILRPRRAEFAPVAHQHWGDQVRYRPGAPGPDPTAPAGAVYFDTTTGRGYRRVDTTEGN